MPNLSMKSVALAGLLLVPSGLAKTIKHDLGTTELGQPKRIVVLEYSFADALASVGIKPVGMAMEKGGQPYLQQVLGDIPSVGTRAQPNLEAIAALKPDLIIADTSRHKDLYERLKSLAPTLVYNSRYASFEDILNQYTTITNLVGQGKLGQSKVNALRQKMENTRRNNPSAGQILIGNSYDPKTFEVFNDHTFVGEFLGRLGFNSMVTGKEAKIGPMSLEGVVSLAPQRIIILQNKADGSIYDTWKDSLLWKALPAVKRQQVYTFDRDLWAKGRGVMAADLMLTQVQASNLIKVK